jgi:hypothetical protein
MTYSNALKFANHAAPLLDIGVLEFVRLRKNEWRSSAFFELAQKTITVTILTKLA